jgi:hypothetical protein
LFLAADFLMLADACSHHLLFDRFFSFFSFFSFPTLATAGSAETCIRCARWYAAGEFHREVMPQTGGRVQASFVWLMRTFYLRALF